jgi:APA family basic amino acid/polyamine antiporter
MPEIKRTLNLFDTVMIVSGSMIGSGIFIVSADMTRVLGSPFWVLMCWLVSSAITLFAALSYGELAGMMPEAGGQFIYLKRAYGRMVSFVYGWTVFAVIQTGVIAAVAVAFAKYIGVLVPFFDEKNILLHIGPMHLSTTQVLAVVMVFFLSYLNSRGINNGKIIQRVFTSAKILALLGLIIIGLGFGWHAGYWEQNMSLSFSPPAEPESGIHMTLFAAMGVALIGSLFSADAWNNVTFIAGEVKDPKKNIPLGLLFGVLIVSVLYILANIAYFMLLPANDIAHADNDRVGTAALAGVFGNTSVVLMAVLITVSTFGCNNGLILSGSRLFQAMANEGLFFRSTAAINRHGVPARALWLQASWASVLCLSGSYGALLDYCTFSSLVFYIITIGALFVLRKREPETPRPYKAFGYPVIPALYILIAGAICVDLLIFKPDAAGIGLLIMMAGWPIYYFFEKRKNGEGVPQ